MAQTKKVKINEVIETAMELTAKDSNNQHLKVRFKLRK